MAKLPNLELIEYQAKIYLSKDQEFKKVFEEKRKENRMIRQMDLVFDSFIQMWGSTCTGFDVTGSGEPAIGGCAMTEAYTVVVHERHTDFYIVFFDGKPCYVVYNASPAFYQDLRQHNMASLSESQKRY